MAIPCDEILQKAPATMAYLAANIFHDKSLGATWPWSVQITAILQQPYAILTFVLAPFSTGVIGFFVAWYLYRERFGRSKDSK